MSAEPGSAPPGPEAWQSRGTVAMQSGARLAWLDMTRGAALLGMVAYHAAWDLHAFGLIDTDPSVHPGWHPFGTAVAALFLALTGFGLSLSARQGVPLRRTWLRLGRIAVAAALVTAATRWAVPQAPIWFGILHCIVVTNVITLALRRAPTSLLLIVAAAAWVAPRILAGRVGLSWSWTGLAAVEPATLDFRPVLPWLAPVLAGMALGRTAMLTQPPTRRAPMRGMRPLGWAGRHSLALYLLHQPVMIGVLAVALGGLPDPNGVAAVLRRPGQVGDFLAECRRACLADGGEQDMCGSTCHCVMTAAVRRAAPPDARDRSVPGTWERSLAAAVDACRQKTSPRVP